MKKQSQTTEYGKELGTGIKEGLKGLNTIASPKKRKTCINLILVPLIIFLMGIIAIIKTNGNSENPIVVIGILSGFGLGFYQFYIGKFKKGLIYTITFGGIVIGVLIDLLKLTVTKTLRDSNGFPIIY